MFFSLVPVVNKYLQFNINWTYEVSFKFQTLLFSFNSYNSFSNIHYDFNNVYLLSSFSDFPILWGSASIIISIKSMVIYKCLVLSYLYNLSLLLCILSIQFTSTWEYCTFQIVRVLRGQGDQWDNRARARGVTASFSLNGIGLVPEETADLYQENEELKVVLKRSQSIAVHVHSNISNLAERRVRSLTVATSLLSYQRWEKSKIYCYFTHFKVMHTLMKLQLHSLAN